MSEPGAIEVRSSVQPAFPLRWVTLEAVVTPGSARPFDRSPAYRLKRHRRGHGRPNPRSLARRLGYRPTTLEILRLKRKPECRTGSGA